MSIEYYQQNADEFFNNTINVNMAELYKPFVSLLKPNALILDAGCGSGRDTKAFRDMGFQLEAIDASKAMVERAKQATQLNVQQKRFNQVDVIEHYDAIWSCASLLHVPESHLIATVAGLSVALKNDGVWYLSFKYGSTQREKAGRLFTDMNEQRLNDLLSKTPNLRLLNTWVTIDKRPDRDEPWLNAILIKKEKN